jgi:hypothetical protein
MAETPDQHAIDVADWLRTLGLDEYAPQFPAIISPAICYQT